MSAPYGSLEQRHANQAATARANFNALSTTSKNRVLKFLSSL